MQLSFSCTCTSVHWLFLVEIFIGQIHLSSWYHFLSMLRLYFTHVCQLGCDFGCSLRLKNAVFAGNYFHVFNSRGFTHKMVQHHETIWFVSSAGWFLLIKGFWNIFFYSISCWAKVYGNNYWHKWFGSCTLAKFALEIGQGKYYNVGSISHINSGSSSRIRSTFIC